MHVVINQCCAALTDCNYTDQCDSAIARVSLASRAFVADIFSSFETGVANGTLQQ